MRKPMMTRQKLGVYRRNWRPEQKPRKRWVGTVTAAAFTPNRVKQVWIV